MNLTRLITATLCFAITLNLYGSSKVQAFEPPTQGAPIETIGAGSR